MTYNRPAWANPGRPFGGLVVVYDTVFNVAYCEDCAPAAREKIAEGDRTEMAVETLAEMWHNERRATCAHCGAVLFTR